jgi:ferritin
MISQPLVDSLNRQLNLEHYSANFYLQMSAWCAHRGLDGTAAFLKGHGAEERLHAERVFGYLNESGAMAVLGSVAAPPTEFDTVVALFETIMKHEVMVSTRINELAKQAFEASDFTTFNFLQWFVAEQHEEENLFRSILDRIELIGDLAGSLYFIDQEIARVTAAAPKVPAPKA